MPPEDTAVVAAPTEATPQPVKAGPSSADLIAKHAKLADKATAAEAAAEEARAPEAKAEDKAKQPKAPKAEAKAKIDPKQIRLEDAAPVKTELEPDGQREKAVYHLKHGDVAKAIDTAFGDLAGVAMPDDVKEALARKLGVGSKNWEQFRKHEKHVKAELSAREQQVSALIDQVKQQYGSKVAAHEAYQKGDYETAFKLAFGEDVADFQRKAISQRVSKNPEVEQLKVQLERERQERLQDKQRLQDDQPQQSDKQIADQYVNSLHEQLVQSDDPQIAKYAQRPRFLNHVIQVLGRHYDAASDTSIPVSQAADIARKEVLSLLNEWEYSGGNTAPSVQAAALPEQPPRAQKAPARNLKQAAAAEATRSPQKLSTKDLQAKYSKIIELTDN